MPKWVLAILAVVIIFVIIKHAPATGTYLQALLTDTTNYVKAIFA